MALKINNQIDASNITMQDGSNLENTKIDLDAQIQTISNKLESFGFIENASAQPYALSADSTVAYVRFNVGNQYSGMNVIATSVLIPGTPYNNICNITVSGVNSSGVIEVEIFGIGFVSAHNFVLNFLLFK